MSVRVVVAPINSRSRYVGVDAVSIFVPQPSVRTDAVCRRPAATPPKQCTVQVVGLG